MLTVVGSINLDLIARVERLPAPGETVSGVGYAEAPGGKGANQALAARRAGHQVAMVGATGTDANAAGALALLRQSGMDLGRVAPLATEPTGVALILVDALTGENQIAVVPGANAQVLADGAPPPLTSECALLLQMEIPDAAIAAALAAARQAGATSWLNIAPYRSGAVALAPLADVVIVNETECAALAAGLGIDATGIEHQIEVMRGGIGATIVVTLGADGALAATETGIVRASSPRIEPIDTVGAGDTFCGYLAAARAEGMDWQAALDLACRAGALACLTPGAQPSIPDRAAVDDFKASPAAR